MRSKAPSRRTSAALALAADGSNRSVPTIAPMASSLSANGDSQRLEAAQNVVQDRFFLKDCEAPDSFGQCGEQCQHFDAGEIHPDAGVGTGAEPEMIARSPAYVETVWVGV